MAGAGVRNEIPPAKIIKMPPKLSGMWHAYSAATKSRLLSREGTDAEQLQRNPGTLAV